MLRAKGLSTYNNNLSEIPEGSLEVADNVVIDRNGVIEPRRGFNQYGNTFGIGTDTVKQLMVYKDRILRHFASTLQYDSNNAGLFLSFAGSYSETEAGLRIKSVEANGNFYFTTSTGIKRISAKTAADFTTAAGFIRNAGGVQALDLNGTVNYTTPGFFTPSSKVAYRQTWCFIDANDNLVEGAPSARLVLINYSTTDSAVTDLSFVIPSEISTTDTQFFYRIYRTAVIQTSVGQDINDIDPGDEMQLVIEDYPTNAELVARMVVVEDVTPESFRQGGAFLYTNPVSGEGILQSNYPPPLAKDVALYQNSVFYANTATRQALSLALLSVQAMISNTSSITITQGATTNTYTFRGQKENTTLTFDTAANTTDGGYFLINAAGNVRKYFVYFGKTGVPERTQFTFDTVAATTNGSYFFLNSANDINQYFIWFDKTGATPAPSGPDTVGKIGLKVSLVGLTLASEVATAVASVISNTLFNIVVNVSDVTVENLSNGVTTDSTAGTVPPGGAFAITILQQGVDSTPVPTNPDTVGRIALFADITTATTATDVAIIAADALLTVVDFDATPTGANVFVSTTDNGNTANAVNGTVPVGGVFAIVVTQQGLGEDQATLRVLLGGSLSPSQNIDETARSLVTIINNNPLEVVNAFYQSGPDDVPGLILLQTRSVSDPTFTITANSTATGNEFNPALPTSGSSVISTNEVEPNALYYSKFQQPEAVPIVNKFNVGPKDKAILRILPLRTGLFIFKEDGIYRVTGQNADFTLDPFDNSALMLSPDSGVVLNNQIYMFSTQGIVSVTDSGVGVISRPIENFLDRITIPSFDYKSATFGVAYETDRAYIMWTVTEDTDTTATQAFRYNTFTQSWTRWPIGKTCGIVKPDTNQLYLGPNDVNFIEKERKNYNRTDYADREYPLQVPFNAVNGLELTLSSVSNVEAGDILFQTQYLTIYQYNQMLKKLDYDPGTGYKDYFETLGIESGADLRNSVNDLALKLDTDPGLSETNFFSSLGLGSTFPDIQSDFNIIVGLLNANVNINYQNFPLSIGTFVFDIIIIERKQSQSNTVILKVSEPIVVGPITLSRGIKSDVVWAPQTVGDPSIAKQYREGTFLFENTVFYSATISYSSDLSREFESTEFKESGVGDWGAFIWGKQNWGGEGSQVPMRTYVPRNKQRCRYLYPRFTHNTSREHFGLYGVSLTFRPLTERAYRE